MKIFLDSYLDNNIGDDLMIVGVAKSFPEYDFYLLSDNSTIYSHLSTYSNIKVYPTNKTSYVLEQIDAYIRLGGSIFQFLNLKQTINRYYKYLKLRKLKKRGVKFGIIGCNVGPFYSKISKIVASKEMKMCDFISVRDQESYNFVKEEVKFDNVKVYDDVVFELLNYFDTKLVSSKIENNKKDILNLGVTAYRSLNNKNLNWDSYLQITELINHLKKSSSLQLKVYLFAFDSEDENDLSAAHHLKGLLSRYEIESVIIPYLGYNIEEFLGVFKKMDKMIAVRFHGAILSDYFNIPYLPIAYSNKLFNYVNDFGLGVHVKKLENFIATNINLDDIQFINKNSLPKEGHLNFLDRNLRDIGT